MAISRMPYLRRRSLGPLTAERPRSTSPLGLRLVAACEGGRKDAALAVMHRSRQVSTNFCAVVSFCQRSQARAMQRSTEGGARNREPPSPTARARCDRPPRRGKHWPRSGCGRIRPTRARMGGVYCWPSASRPTVTVALGVAACRAYARIQRAPLSLRVYSCPNAAPHSTSRLFVWVVWWLRVQGADWPSNQLTQAN